MANGMGNLAARTAAEVNAKFAEREAELVAETALEWEQIKPQLEDADYGRLMAEVQAATNANESLGQLINRLENLAVGGVALAAKVKKFIVF